MGKSEDETRMRQALKWAKANPQQLSVDQLVDMQKLSDEEIERRMKERDQKVLRRGMP